MNKPITENGYFKLNNLIEFCKKHFKHSIKYSFYAILLFSVYFFLKPDKYSSTLSFYTNYQNVNNPSLLSPFLSDIAGLEESGLKFSVSEFLASDKFLEHIVVKSYDIDDTKKTLVNHWGKHYNNYFNLNPLDFLKTINRNIMFSNNLNESDKKLVYAKEILKNKISFSENRKSSLNTISINIKKYPNLSKEIIEQIYLSLLSYSNEINSIKAAEKIIFIDGRIKEIQKNLKSSEERMVIFVVQNKNLESSPLLLLEKDRIQRKINLHNSLYLSLSNQLELAKIDEQDNTSSVFLLDPVHKNSYIYGSNFLISVFSTFVFALIFLFSFRLYRDRQELFL